MRSALWTFALCAAAVAAALFLSSNQATITLFWHPYRVDMSLNLVLFGLTLVALLAGFLVWALASVWRMPAQARAWRQYRHELASYQALLQGLEHLCHEEWQQADATIGQARQLMAANQSQTLPTGSREAEEMARFQQVADWLAQRAREAGQSQTGNPVAQSREVTLNTLHQ